MTNVHPSLKQTLRSANQSVTTTRQRVFETVARQHPIDMAELIQSCNGVDRSSVYRTVELFEQLNIFVRIYSGWKYKLELSDQFSDHHHHITCSQCGHTVAIKEDVAIEDTISRLAKSAGYIPQSHQLEILGLCPTCQK